MPTRQSISIDRNRAIEGARNGSPFELVALARNWTTYSDPFEDDIPSIFFQYLNSLEVPVDVNMDPLDTEPSEQPSVASATFIAYWCISGIGGFTSLDEPYPDYYEPKIVSAWPGIFKWGAFFFASRVQGGTLCQETSIHVDDSPQFDRSTFLVRAVTRDLVVGAWWGIMLPASPTLKNTMIETSGFFEVLVGLWLHKDSYKLEKWEIEANKGDDDVIFVPCSYPMSTEFLAYSARDVDMNFVETLISVVGGPERTVLMFEEKLAGVDLISQHSRREGAFLLRLIVVFLLKPQIREAILNHGVGAACTKLLVRVAACIQESYPERCPNLEGLLPSGFLCVAQLIKKTEGFSSVIQVINAGLLSAFVEASPVFYNLEYDKYKVISELFSDTISSYLCFRSVLLTVDTMLQNLKRTERFHSLPKSRGWKVFSDFTKLTAERKALITIRNQSFKKSAAPCSNIQCHKRNALNNFRRCANCLSAFYCSKECQLAHWKHGHKIYCKERTADDLLPCRDQEYIEQLNPREATIHLPYLKALAAKQHPDAPLEDLMVVIDYSQIPVNFSLVWQSEGIKANSEALIWPKLQGAELEIKIRTPILAICPYGREVKNYLQYITGGIWSAYDQQPKQTLDPSGKRYIDGVDMLARAKWREYWGISE
ncbi:hypothetical protein BDN72DRAFT_958738 [Pluteus cervinus]|uniref:Uncharacterized protein n=1 Tax=Pluteus cervinus TaxID=181527 RepID=A0ACD3AY75_9AGAR|nr:hypothetical protein BDN72DRAFT_958738 [Pluteus cervinus]